MLRSVMPLSLQVNDVGVLGFSGNIPSLPEELKQTDKLLSKYLTPQP